MKEKGEEKGHTAGEILQVVAGEVEPMNAARVLVDDKQLISRATQLGGRQRCDTSRLCNMPFNGEGVQLLSSRRIHPHTSAACTARTPAAFTHEDVPARPVAADASRMIPALRRSCTYRSAMYACN